MLYYADNLLSGLVYKQKGIERVNFFFFLFISSSFILILLFLSFCLISFLLLFFYIMSFRHDIERKSSTTTTLCSPSIKGLTKTSTVSSRRSSTPLADRFMSSNYIVKEEEKIIIEMEPDNITPEYSSQNDLLLLTTPPPLFHPTDSKQRNVKHPFFLYVCN